MRKISLLFLISFFIFNLIKAQTYNFDTKLLASDGASDDMLGNSVSVYGDFAFVGSYYNDDDGLQSGAVYVWKYNGTDWGASHFEKLTAGTDANNYANFGNSVSIYGNHAVIGAWGDSEGGSYSGAIYIYHYDGTTWGSPTKITGDANYDTYGASVCISNDYMIVGASYKNGTGSADIYHYNGSSWVLDETITPSDGEAADLFGTSVSISGEYAVVGSPDHNSDAGAAYIYHFNETDWQTDETKITETGDNFGYSVSISNNKVVVGTKNYGKTYIFTNSGSSWIQTQSFGSADGSAFGEAVSISGDKVIIGDWEESTNTGGAYIYSFNGTSWSSQTLNKTNITSQERFGNSVCISDNKAIVGAFWDDDVAEQAGSASLYITPPPSAPTITNQAQNTATCEGGSANFSITGTNINTYQWYNTTGTMSDGGDISGATSNNLQIANTEQADEDNYYCIVTGDGGNLQSNNASLAVDLPVAAVADENVVVCLDYASISANSPVYGLGTWTSSDLGTTINTPNSNNTAVFDLAPGETIFTWTIVNGACVDSDDIIVTRNVPVTINSHPESITPVSGTSINFSVSVSETIGTTYQWQKNNTDLDDVANISGVYTNTLNIFGVGVANEGAYHVIVTDACGDITSNDASLTIASGLNNIKLKKNNIYPNPAHNVLFFNNDNISNIEIFNVLGKREQFNYSSDLNIIDISKLQAGIYFLRYKHEGKYIQVKFLKK